VDLSAVAQAIMVLTGGFTTYITGIMGSVVYRITASFFIGYNFSKKNNNIVMILDCFTRVIFKIGLYYNINIHNYS
jgi:hypothetical protein